MSGHESHSRIPSMDQFRGYAILTMIFVNFVGRFDATPWMLQHHRTGMSFNDTIAPIFIFVVGMGFRLSLLRRAEKIGIAAARKAAAWRYAKLTILGFIVYFGYFWDALSDIGVAGLLTLFLIDKSPAVRIAAAFGLLGAYQALFSLAGYGEWVMRESVNGGPLGPLSWAFILLMGTVAYDA
ncbi:MAG TPA: heparan-alpha-glucosaminide N-acetyltransferase domain-containing protein, partial [Candidatus Hydrogenedentes bacterium]|nr:heparan-alpha-glucosaminide N-acetyltransferase domain-containing protein [Candidatus Hydrogenedentota bacterium]